MLGPRVRLPTSRGVHPLNPAFYRLSVSLLGQLDRDSLDSFQEGRSPPALGALQLSMLWLAFQGPGSGPQLVLPTVSPPGSAPRLVSGWLDEHVVLGELALPSRGRCSESWRPGTRHV